VIASIVDSDALLQVLWVSLIAGVGVTASYAVGMLGAQRALQSGREGRAAEAAIYAVLGVAGFAAFVAAIVFGIVILTAD
jgi:hypothetical protein